MPLTQGTDTYISLADADAYLASNYIASEPKMIAWAALSDGDCEILLRRAARALDRQIYVGMRSLFTQKMEFPRAIPTDVYRGKMLPVGYTYIGDVDYVIQTAVPDAVKYAQAEEAFVLASGTPKRIELQRQNVKSFSLGNLSESFGSTSSTASLVSLEARELLKPFIAGNVPIV
jgi:hypothetical protein